MSLTLTLVQTALVWEDKAANLAHFDELLAAPEPSDLIVLPEMFTTGFSMNSASLAEPMSGESVQWMRRLAIRLERRVTGSLIIRDQDRCVNRLVLMSPDGSIQFYDKKHLFRMSEENNNYSAGAEPLTVQINDFTVSFQICYDLRFPVWLRNRTGPASSPRHSYDLLLFVANWPAARREHWRTLLQARAIENLSYVVGVNRIGEGNAIDYSGDTLAVDFNGQLLCDLQNREEVCTVTLDHQPLRQYRNTFPAWKDADPFDLATAGRNQTLSDTNYSQ
ncbi:MAG: amidohydrolase [Pseudomonadales bacterium]|nr:amidohydrolase [Pseudomonadales bacterium]